MMSAVFNRKDDVSNKQQLFSVNVIVTSLHLHEKTKLRPDEDRRIRMNCDDVANEIGFFA
jgi:hypothetical protein